MFDMCPDHTVHLCGLPSESAMRLASFLTAQDLSVTHDGEIEDLLWTSGEAEATCLITTLPPEDTSISTILRRLAEVPNGPTVIFVTTSDDVCGAVRAMKEGAMEVLKEPIDLTSLLAAVYAAFERNKQVRARRRERMELTRRYERLTKRERQVLPLVLGGLLVKQGAGVLGIANITMQVHRAQIMRKMEANSLADLVRMGVKLGVRHADSLSRESAKGGPCALHAIAGADGMLTLGRGV
jgi:FixJ family two-component response regulator